MTPLVDKAARFLHVFSLDPHDFSDLAELFLQVLALRLEKFLLVLDLLVLLFILLQLSPQLLDLILFLGWLNLTRLPLVLPVPLLSCPCMCFLSENTVITFLFIILLDPFYQLISIRFYARFGIYLEDCMELLALLVCAGFMELAHLLHLSFHFRNYTL